MILESGVNGAATHLIQRIAVPPAVHVGFSETECPRSQDPIKEMPVMHPNVPRARAVDANVRGREKSLYYVLGSGHNDLAGRERFGPCLKNRTGCDDQPDGKKA